MSKAIPEDWSAATLDRFCDVIGGGTPSRGVSEYWCGDIPWASPTEITTRTSKYISSTKESITKLGLEKSSAKILPPGSVLMTSRASIGYVAINTVPMTTNQGFQSLKCKKDSASADYMYQYITWIRPELEKMSAGSTFSEISSASVKRLHVTLPPLPEQQKIASILSSVDNVIEKTRAQIDKLKDLKTGMMQELLTKGIGHTEFKDSPVGLVPMQWEIVKFEDVFSDYKYGPRFSSKDYSSCGNVKTIRGTDLSSDGEVHYNQVPTASIDAKTVESHRLRDGDLVMITTAECGSSAVFREQKMPYIASAYAIKLSPTDRVFPEFIKYFMQTPNAMVQIESFIRKGTVANLPGSDVMNIVLALPAYLEQKEIASMLLALDTKIARVSQKLAHVASIKKALMQDLLTGKVRIKTQKDMLKNVE